MSEVIVRQLTNEDLKIYKETRLRSLNDWPDTFSASYERECEFSEEESSARVSVSDRVSQALPLIAELDEITIGIACGVVHSPGDKSAKIYQMWVEPEKRGQGVGKLLLDRIIDWAENAKIGNLELTVTTSNTEAVNLYQSYGFVASGGLEPLRPGSQLSTQNMVLKVSANAA